MAGGARCRVRSGGGLRSSRSFRTGPKVSAIEQQESLVKRYPGATYIMTRPKSSGPAISASLPDDYEYDACQKLLDTYYDMSRLCGSDNMLSKSHRSTIRFVCDINVPADDIYEKACTSTNAAAAAHGPNASAV